MCSLAVLALLLLTADAYSYQRPNYRMPSGSGYQYHQNLHFNTGNRQINQQYKNYNYSPGHAYVENSQHQILKGDQLSNLYQVHGAQQVNFNNKYSTLNSPGHAYYGKSLYQSPDGPLLNGNQININSEYGAPAALQSQFDGLAPIRQHGTANLANHAYIEKSQYQFLHGPESVDSQYNAPNTNVPQQVNNHHYATSNAPGLAYVEKSQYQFQHGTQLDNEINLYSSANSLSNGLVNQYGNANGHVYHEKSQYQFLHGDQLTNNQIQFNAVGNSNSAGYNVQQTTQDSSHEHHHDKDFSHLINVSANGAKSQTNNIQPNSIPTPVQGGDGHSVLKPYQQTELRNTNVQSGFQQSIQPVISKHVYFHVPPADIEETQLRAIQSPLKKNYKIIFIKVPSQESKNSALLQQQVQNQLAATETKTLIYVLSKKPEEATQVPPSPSEASKPEVFYVKYNKSTQFGDIVTKISEQ